MIHTNNVIHPSKTAYLKYTVFHLNEDEIVLRLMNMAESEQMSIMKYEKNETKGKFLIDSIGLNLEFVDIVESYANGIPKEQNWRRYWSKNTDEINVYNQGGADTAEIMTLRPLEIRSFRINFRQKIAVNDIKSSTVIADVEVPETETKSKNIRRNRCF